MSVNTYRCRQKLAAVVLLVLAELASGVALAGSFTITPVRIFLTPRDRATAITVTNEGETPLVMQAELFNWKQSAQGADELTPTDDVFLTPPIIKLEPKARQVVRLVRMAPPNLAEQTTYRMFVREVPEAIKNNTEVQVQVALAFNIPIFYTPPELKPDFACSVQRAAPDLVSAVCANKGKAHIHPVKLVLSDGKGTVWANHDSGGYLLANITRAFELKRKDGAIPAGIAKLDVTFADGSNVIFDQDIPK